MWTCTSIIYDERGVFQARQDMRLKGPADRAFGGARRDRTADLLNAIQALSQLSYGPGAEAGMLHLN
jgi:hypothetical protein